MQLFWTPEAAQDRLDIFEYIESDNPTAALLLDELFEKKAARLIDHPGFGRSGRIAGTRELVVHKHYLLVYDHDEAVVRVPRVLHTARQWPQDKPQQ